MCSLPPIVHRFELRRWDVPDGLEKPTMVEPVDPLERGELDVVEAPPRPRQADHLRLVEPVDRLGQGVVVGVPLAADRGLDPHLGEPLRVADRQVLDTAIAVMNQPVEV